ncbi:hypothetical protein ACFR97_07590 [Haloplanus litoreus]|uniref:hypothetical protein n=1 Tax=Haloplanus litoreus TaxID=767515 RepID=UPI00362C0CCD
MHRRALLSAGMAVATAGCFDFGRGCSRSATLELSAVSDADVADGAESRSVLVPEPSYDTLRVGGRAVASTPREFAPLVYERHGVDPADRDLSAEQRDIVETAIDEGYDECAPYSDAFAALQRTLGQRMTRETDDGSGVATIPAADAPERVDYANYENEWYAVDLHAAAA